MNVIIIGVTGMVGKGVLIECFEHSDVEKILVINRASLNIKHDKLEEVIHDDFTKFENIKVSLNRYDACIYCLGVSSVGLNEQQYTIIIMLIRFGIATLLSKRFRWEYPKLKLHK